MYEIRCAICNKRTGYKVLYRANFKEKDIAPNIYVSRRLPDKLHFRIVKCRNCGLVYSSPIVEKRKILSSYKNSNNYPEEDIDNLTDVYEYYMRRKIKLHKNSRILEIGSGNSRFLFRLFRQGYKYIYGVEPSRKAVTASPRGLDKSKIRVDFFKAGQFKSGFFDVVVFFQVLDHVLDPNRFLKTVFQVLKPGGQILALVHDSSSWTSKLFGERSPIFDLQHIHLFDRKNLVTIFQKHGFKVVSVFPTFSKYSLLYWLKIIPVPRQIKDMLNSRLFKFMSKINVKINAGNMAILAKKI